MRARAQPKEADLLPLYRSKTMVDERDLDDIQFGGASSDVYKQMLPLMLQNVIMRPIVGYVVLPKQKSCCRNVILPKNFKPYPEAAQTRWICQQESRYKKCYPLDILGSFGQLPISQPISAIFARHRNDILQYVPSLGLSFREIGRMAPVECQAPTTQHRESVL